MTTKRLVQIVSYVSPELKDRIEEDRRRFRQRVSMSAYIESILWQHVEHQTKKRPGKVVNA